MVPYTTNYTTRGKTTAWLAFVAVALVMGVGWRVNDAINLITAGNLWLGLVLGPLSPMVVFTGLYAVYDRWAWKQPWLLALSSGIPNLSGTWLGSVTFEDDLAEAPYDCEVTLVQTWTTIRVGFVGRRAGERKTNSEVIMAALNKMDEPNGGLRYEYEVQPESDADMQPRTIGTAYLKYAEGTKRSLTGKYYNETTTVGGTVIHHYGAYNLERQARAQRAHA